MTASTTVSPSREASPGTMFLHRWPYAVGLVGILAIVAATIFALVTVISIIP